jgi:NADPH:quinone reductase-like Zn-dependent oxidoreductase
MEAGFPICREIGTDFAGQIEALGRPVDKLWITREAVDMLWITPPRSCSLFFYH